MQMIAPHIAGAVVHARRRDDASVGQNPLADKRAGPLRLVAASR